MNYCVTPGCLNPQNPDNAKFCLSCGATLLLKDRYRPIQPIGRGGFGKTFLGVDEQIPSKPRCVIKQLYLQTQGSLALKKATQLFHQEAQRLDELGQHPQIPTLVAHFEQQKQLYLVQEFIQGKTLERELQKSNFNETQIWELLQGILPILKFIHDRKVLHRDIKPGNIMRQSQDGKLVLIDFGVAKQITDSALFHTGTAVGTPGYMPPEQEKGKALPASDLYSLGVTCIHLLTGVSVFELFDFSNHRWVWRDYLPNETTVSDRLARILNKLLQHPLNLRYKSADEVLQALALPQPSPSKPLPPPKETNLITNLWRRYAAGPQGDVLTSEVGVDYRNLQRLLAAGKWQQADEETWARMCEALDKSPRSYIQSSEIDKFPGEDLETINRLWVKYSQGRFGFSVQKQIYDKVEQDFGKFCSNIGWLPYKQFRSYLRFSASAPQGHLPSWSWANGNQLSRHAAMLSAKLEACHIL
jgi:serine/threonine protein kinase